VNECVLGRSKWQLTTLQSLAVANCTPLEIGCIKLFAPVGQLEYSEGPKPMKQNRQRTARNEAIIPRRNFLWRGAWGIGGVVLSSVLNPGSLFAAFGVKRPRELIGFTEFRTNLPGGRQANEITMRAGVVRTD
jgi:hypothetical protein